MSKRVMRVAAGVLAVALGPGVVLAQSQDQGAQGAQRAQQAQPAPDDKTSQGATQGATDPPTFTLFATKEVPPSYLRYLERMFREAFDLGSVPVKLRVRRRGS